MTAEFKAIKTGNNRQTIYKNRKAYVHVNLPDARELSKETVNKELERRAKTLVKKLSGESGNQLVEKEN